MISARKTYFDIEDFHSPILFKFFGVPVSALILLILEHTSITLFPVAHESSTLTRQHLNCTVQTHLAMSVWG